MLSVVFTWDDNFKRHFLLTAPIFEKHSMTCTFYVMPGEEGYMADEYKKLIGKGFEMGSHGYTHDDFTKMTLSEAKENMEKSIAAMEHSLGVRPKTFAFPYHRYSGELWRRQENILLRREIPLKIPSGSTLCRKRHLSI